MDHGGKRIGAGRKKGFSAKTAEEARKVLAEMVVQEIGPIGEALIARAKNGEVAAIKELFDRAFGKALQTARIDSSVHIEPTPLITLIKNASESDPPPIYGGYSVRAIADGSQK